MPSLQIPTFSLPGTGDSIPAVGFGSGSKHRLKKWGNPDMDDNSIDSDIVDVITDAIDAGFNHLDGAETYTTRAEMGMAIKKAGISRNHLWITDKYDQGWANFKRASTSPSGPRESIMKGLKALDIEYYDLFLIHSPFFDEKLVDVTLFEAWRQLEQCYEEGLVRNIGVSNFDVKHLQELMKFAKYKPQVNQIEYHLYLQNQTDGISDYCRKNNIQIEAYCPLTPILESRINDAKHPLKPVLKSLCEKYDVEPSVISLRWIYQSGVIPITTSSNFERMKQTFKMFDFELTDEEFYTLKKIGESYKVRAYFPELFEK